MLPSVRSLSVLALGAFAACASVPALDPSVGRSRYAAIAPSDFASDSLDLLQCAQRVGASGGFFLEDSTGTVLVRRPGTTPVELRGTVPVRRPGTVPIQPPGTVSIQPAGARQVRILLRPRSRNGWARANARAPGSDATSTRDLVQLMNSRCTLRRATG